MFHASGTALILGDLLHIFIVTSRIFAMLYGATTLFNATLKLGGVELSKYLRAGIGRRFRYNLDSFAHLLNNPVVASGRCVGSVGHACYQME